MSALVCLCFYANAQTKTQNKNVWFHYLGKNMINKKLSFTLETTMRFANGLSEKQQWFVRPSVDYQFAKSFMGSVGYTHYNTYVYGNPSLYKTNIPENHLWFQGVFVQNSGNFKFTHRLRDEFRYVGIATKNGNDYQIDHFDYRNRLRYMLLVNYSITKIEGKIKTYGFLGDEVFMNIGTKAGATFLNQNRIIAGLGYNLDTYNQIQLSYIGQHIWNFTNTLQEINPTVRLSYVTNFNL